MLDGLTIGEAARRTGMPAKTIRFYEDRGIIPAPIRTEAGYRLYGPVDIRRLRLVRLAKLLGMSLPEVKTLVEQAFASECDDFAEQFLQRIAHQQAEIDRRIAELESLKGELVTVARHVEHSQGRLLPHQTVAGCDFCPILDVEPGMDGAERADSIPGQRDSGVPR